MDSINKLNTSLDGSPFHKGEQEIQSRLHVRDKMERFGKQVIRDFMPAQHRDFFRQLAFVFVGHADYNHWPWASILYGKPGFITSNDPKHLKISAEAIEGDPLHLFLNQSDKENRRIALLGIELPSRRRNRLSGQITNISKGIIDLKINQAFGNCPQYIQTRNLEYVDLNNQVNTLTNNITELDADAISLINTSDTFFVASFVATGTDHESEGVDVSHRGGRTGFIRVDNAKTLTIPDFPGNFHFNTLGNFLVNPKAGLLFMDFENGHILTLTGTVEILWDSPDTQYFTGAERLWQFRIDHGHWIKNALPLRWTLDEPSPNSVLTGTWEEAQQIKSTENKKTQWHPHEVVNIVNESSVIKSFYLKPPSGIRPTFKAGQFLTLRSTSDNKEIIRTYTISSAPVDAILRISVKKEGIFSNLLHDTISIGDTIDTKAPTGTFIFDAAEERPAVLISAGVGITPMVSMAQHTLIEGFRTRSMRQLTLINAAHSQSQRAFFNELNELADKSNGYIKNIWVLSQIENKMTLGKDYHHKGRISRELLQTILPVDDYDFYLCGPQTFMQSIYDMLDKLGVNDNRIYSEAFGSSAIVRKNTTTLPLIANEAIVEFKKSGVEQLWSKGDGTLLEFAESHGLTPEFSCRNGQCGSCKTTLLSGKVTYQQNYTATIANNEILLCCAVPAKTDGNEIASISLQL